MTERKENIEPPKVYPLKSQAAEVILDLKKHLPPNQFHVKVEELPIHHIQDAAHCFRKAAYVAFETKPEFQTDDIEERDRKESYNQNLNWLLSRPAQAAFETALTRAKLVAPYAFYNQEYKISGSYLLHQNPQNHLQLVRVSFIPQFIIQDMKGHGMLLEQERELILAMHLLNENQNSLPVAGANLLTLPIDSHWTKKNLFEQSIAWSRSNQYKAQKYLDSWQQARNEMNLGRHPEASALSPVLCNFCEYNSQCWQQPETSQQKAGQLKLGPA